MSQQRELEWQMTAGDLPAVRRWLVDNATLADLQIEPRDSIHLHDTYLDTDDWRFHRAGFALRARASAGAREATLTLPRIPDRVAPASDPAMRVDDVVRAELRRRLDQWAANEPGARLGADPERLHNLRIAGRRIDATLRLFQGFLPRRMGRVRQRVKKLLRVLGVARDLDVQLATLGALAADLSDAEREALGPARAPRCRSRARAHANAQGAGFPAHATLAAADRRLPCG